jgi:hypothetical protein
MSYDKRPRQLELRDDRTDIGQNVGPLPRPIAGPPMVAQIHSHDAMVRREMGRQGSHVDQRVSGAMQQQDWHAAATEISHRDTGPCAGHDGIHHGGPSPSEGPGHDGGPSG